MAHALQERYSSMVDAKLRATLVKKNGVVFNTRYEGTPKAGAVKIPVRDTEVVVSDYDKADGITLKTGATSYTTLTIDKDKAVNEIIDGYDAAAVPDNLTADRLDSAGYSLALQMENDSTVVLEAAATTFGTTTALTASTVYGSLVDLRTTMTKAHVPNDGKRYALVTPDVFALILKSDEFTPASQLGDAVKQSGILGRIVGLNIIEDTTLSETTEFLAGHPDWCSRVEEWQVPVKLQDLSGSGDYIGAVAVQGRKIYAHKVTKASTLFIKKKAASQGS